MPEKTPKQLAQERLSISYDYAKLGERLAELKVLKALWWQAVRGEYKSDASAERAWDLTKEGQEYEKIKLKMKTKEMKSSALRTLLEVVQNENQGHY